MSGAQLVALERLDECHYRVNGDLKFATVAKLARSESLRFVTGGVLRLDLSGVGKVDSSALALLVSWLGIARAETCEISFENIPANLQQLLALYQIDRLLPEAIS